VLLDRRAFGRAWQSDYLGMGIRKSSKILTIERGRTIMTTMKKMSAVLAVLLFMTGSALATDITEVVLGPGNGIITFTGLGATSPNELSLTLGNLNVPNFVLAGRGFGKGLLLGVNAPYKILTPQSDVITAVAPGLGTTSWLISQSAPEAFSWGPGGSLLTGTFNLVDFSQGAGLSGVFNDTGIFNMKITGGSEASIFGGIDNTASIDLILHFQSKKGQDISKLVNTTASYRASLSSGEVLPTPEPATLSLFGTGLLGISYVTRRRIRKVNPRNS
jgi:hypothetical protein